MSSEGSLTVLRSSINLDCIRSNALCISAIFSSRGDKSTLRLKTVFKTSIITFEALGSAFKICSVNCPVSANKQAPSIPCNSLANTGINPFSPLILPFLKIVTLSQFRNFLRTFSEVPVTWTFGFLALKVQHLLRKQLSFSRQVF